MPEPLYVGWVLTNDQRREVVLDQRDRGASPAAARLRVAYTDVLGVRVDLTEYDLYVGHPVPRISPRRFQGYPVKTDFYARCLHRRFSLPFPPPVEPASSNTCVIPSGTDILCCVNRSATLEACLLLF